MTATNEIDLALLERRLVSALSALRARGARTFRTETEYFWAVGDVHLDDEMTPQVTIGQVSWTLDNLAGLDRDEDVEEDELVAWRLKWLTELLTVISADLLHSPRTAGLQVDP